MVVNLKMNMMNPNNLYLYVSHYTDTYLKNTHGARKMAYVSILFLVDISSPSVSNPRAAS